METIKKAAAKTKTTLSASLRSVYHFIDRRPLQSFFTVLGLLLALIILGNIIRNPAPPVNETVRSPKEVRVYSIGSAPRVMAQAKIEKTGVVKITAIMGGVVQKIYKREGDDVSRGTWIVWLSSNYQGGTAATVTRQIAQTNYNFLKDNYDSQKEIIAKNREMAEKAEAQTADLRDIGAKSVDETKSLITLNENVISMLDDQLKSLEAINVNGSSNSAILQLKTGKASALAGLNQARAALRSSEYQTGSDNEPAQIARLQKEATLKQLELQEKTLDLNREISLLNLRLSQIQEALMYPASPVKGRVERIHVKEGQFVNPGQVLATVTGNANGANALVYVSGRIAQGVSNLEPSTLRTNGKSISVYPAYISGEPTEGSLHSILFRIPDEHAGDFGNEQILTVEMPIGMADTNSVMPYVPLDAVYRTESESYIFMVSSSEPPKAESRKVEIGNVAGEYVEVKTGLKRGDQVIVDRNVVAGDELSVSR